MLRLASKGFASSFVSKYSGLGKQKINKMKKVNSKSIHWSQFELICLTRLIFLYNKKVLVFTFFSFKRHGPGVPGAGEAGVHPLTGFWKLWS